MDWIIRYMKGNDPVSAYQNNSNDTRRMIKTALRYYAAQSHEVRGLFIQLYGRDHEIIREIDDEGRFASKWMAEYCRAEAMDRD